MRTPRLRRALLLCAGVTLVPCTLAAQSAIEGRLTVERYLDLESVSSPRISPDGSQIVYVRGSIDKVKDRRRSSLWIMDADGGRNRFLTDGSGAEWSPDGSRIAYVADAGDDGAEIFVRYLDAPEPTQVTRLEQSPGSLHWSPDGKWIGFAMTVPTPDSAAWPIDMPKAPKNAEWTKAPRVVRTLHYRADRRGYLDPAYTHLFVVPADGGTPRDVTPGDWSVGARFDGQPGGVSWDWMPDGRAIVVEGLRTANPDTIYRDAYLYRIDVATGNVQQLTPERGTWTSPIVSPDGRRIAFSGDPYSRMSYRASALYVMNADGSGMRTLSADLDRDPGNITWAPDGDGIYFTADDHGTSNLYYASLSGSVRKLTDGAHMLQLASVARDGTAVGVLTTATQPTDVVRFTLRQPERRTQLTHVNDDVLAGVRLGELEELRFTSADGTEVQGWLVRPPGFDPARRYPLIMEIHGGPHGMYNVGFNPMFQNFAANDFVVLYTNPRGSTGYGTAFGNAIERQYPGVDYDDLMAGVDAALATGYVDEQNMFVGGCSGGGVLTSWVIGHTDRFKAASVRCPVTNWLSFLGHTDVPYFTANFFDKPFWEDPEPWLKQSPLMYVGNVKTPTVVMTGILDLRTPMPQSEEYYAALRLRGVPSALLRFENEYHGTGSQPSNWIRTQLYMMDWYRQWGTFDGKTRERVTEEVSGRP